MRVLALLAWAGVAAIGMANAKSPDAEFQAESSHDRQGLMEEGDFASWNFDLSNGSLSDAVLEYTAEFKDLVAALGDTYSVYSSLDKIQRRSWKFLQMGSPIGALIAAGASIVIEPSTEELDAIKLLHKEVNIMKQENRNVQYHLVKFLSDLFLLYWTNLYNNLVTIALIDYQQTLKHITDSSATTRQRVREVFVNQCSQSTTGPNYILGRMERFFGTECVPYDASIVKVLEDLEKLRKVIRHIDRTMGKQQSAQWHGAKLNALLGFPSMNHSARAKILEVISTATQPEILKQLSGISTNASCYFYYGEIHSDYQRGPMRSQHNQVMLDVTRLMMLLSQCANITSNGDPREVTNQLTEARSYVSSITTKSRERLFVLERYYIWPGVQTHYAKLTIGNMDVSYAEASYNQTAMATVEDFDARGEDFYDYYALVSVHDPENQQWCGVGNTQHHATNFEVSGVDVQVVRYDVTKTIFTKEKFVKWFNYWKPFIHDSINAWADDDACVLLNKLSAKYNFAKNFERAVIFRKVQRTHFGIEILVGQHHNILTDAMIFEIDYYWNNPIAPWTSTYHYRLFLLR